LNRVKQRIALPPPPATPPGRPSGSQPRQNKLDAEAFATLPTHNASPPDLAHSLFHVCEPVPLLVRRSALETDAIVGNHDHQTLSPAVYSQKNLSRMGMLGGVG